MIIGRAIMALPIIFVAVLNFDSPYYRSADSPILPYAVSLFRVRETGTLFRCCFILRNRGHPIVT